MESDDGDDRQPVQPGRQPNHHHQQHQQSPSQGWHLPLSAHLLHLLRPLSPLNLWSTLRRIVLPARMGNTTTSSTTSTSSPSSSSSSTAQAMSSLNDIPSSTSTLVSFGTDWTIGQFSSLGREAVRSPYFGADVGSPAQFRMVLYPRGDGNHPDYVALFLEMQPNENIEMVEAYIKFTIDSVGPEFIGANKSLHCFNGRGTSTWGYSQFIKRKELLDPLNCWLEGDELKVNCEVIIVPPFSKLNKDLPMLATSGSSDTYRDCFLNEKLSDVVFVVEGKEMPANKYIIAMKSPVLLSTFENDGSLQRVRLSDEEVSYEVFHQFLEYLYTDTLSTASLEAHARALLPLAEKFQVGSLKSLCEQYLCSQLTAPESALEHFSLAEKHNANRLKAKALNLIRRQITEAVLQNNDLLTKAFRDLVVRPGSERGWLQKAVFGRLSGPNIAPARVSTFSHLWRIEKLNYLLEDDYRKRRPVLYSSNFGDAEHQHQQQLFRTFGETAQFHLELHPRGVNLLSRKYVSLFLDMATSAHAKEKVRYQLSIVDVQGRKCLTKGNDHLFSAKTFKRGYLGHGFNFFIKRSALVKAADRLLPNGTLTILCEIQVQSKHSPEKKAAEDEPKKKSGGGHSRSSSSGSWLASEKLSDVVLVLGDEEIRAHKVVLRSSKMFSTMFQCDMKESAEKRVQINEADEVAFKEMLAYLYTGHCTLPMRRMARPLLQLADKYQIDSLKELCEEHLSCKITQDTALELLELAKLHNASGLATKVLQYIKGPTLQSIEAIKDPALLVKVYQKLVLKNALI